MDKRFIVNRTKEGTFITDTDEINDICTVEKGFEDFAEWICESLNYWYSQTDKYLKLTPPILEVMQQAFDNNIAPKAWVNERIGI